MRGEGLGRGGGKEDRRERGEGLGVVGGGRGTREVMEGGRGLLEERRGSPERLRRVGIDGPKISVSRIPARWPCRLNARARFTKATWRSATRTSIDMQNINRY